MPKYFKVKFIISLILFSIVPFFTGAQTVGQSVVFNIDSFYDLQNRQELSAVLIKSSDQLYFYADKEWWNNLSYSKRQDLEFIFSGLEEEFAVRIYPELTSVFGSEPKPGVDGSEKTTVLMHPMISEAGGYFNTGDAYSRYQYPRSNERNMVYLNSEYVDNSQAKVFLAHEFMHLITLNQKDLLRGVSEEIWLNEARSEYTATLLGYNDIYQGSNLQRRVNNFLSNPLVSLTEWTNKKEDYGVINLFTHYLVDHYGVEILVDSLKSDFVGIKSINHALEKNNYEEDFLQVFNDWLITLLVNDCTLGERYCYLNRHLENFRITPSIYYLPQMETVMSSLHNTTYWAPNWHRFVGGGKDLTLEFEGNRLLQYSIPYLLCDFEGSCLVYSLDLDENQEGKTVLEKFREKYSSLTIMPFIKNKISGFNGKERSFSFKWNVTIEDIENEKRKSELRAQLLEKIAELQEKVRLLQAQLAVLRGETAPLCKSLDNNLYFGMRNNTEVNCLQVFLKNQGSDIYPEALVTGNFLSLTRQAVVRFQEKYASEILNPLGLQTGTGYVGPATREKINEILSY